MIHSFDQNRQGAAQNTRSSAISGRRAGTLASDDGFVLVLALGLGLLLSAGAVVLLQTTRDRADDLQVARAELQRRAAADAGSALALVAIASRRTEEAETELPPVELGGMKVRVRLASEAAKVDVNAADPTLVAAALADAVPPKEAALALDRILAARSAGETLATVRAPLPPCLRSTALAHALERGLTVATGDRTVSRRLVPSSLLQRLPGMTRLQMKLLEEDRAGAVVFHDDPRIAPVAGFLGEPASVWTVETEVLTEEGATFGRRALLGHPAHAPPVVIAAEDVPPALPDAFCR